MAKKILVCVGHGKSAGGGYDPGATANGYEEYNLAKMVALSAYNYLKNYQTAVDIININKEYYLLDRIKFANKNNYDFVAEIHLNAGNGHGSEVYYSHDSTQGKLIASQISHNISNVLNISDRGAKTKLNDNGTDYFGIIRSTNAEAVLVETCFIDTDDVNRLTSQGNFDKTGMAIANAIAKGLNLPEKSESGKIDLPEASDIIKKGDVVYFSGGNIYVSSSAEKAASVRGKSICNVTAVSYGAAHSLHLISRDGAGVYGWVDAANVMKNTLQPSPVKAGSIVRVINNAKTYTGGSLADFVYKRAHVVKEINGQRAVITYNGVVVAAINTANLIPI